MRRGARGAIGIAIALVAPLVASSPARPADEVARGEWVAGDLHAHTPYSHDSYGGPGDDNTGPEEAYLLGNTVRGNFESAARRGLDYLAITDHNDIRSQQDPGFGIAGVIPVAGYENSLRGHAQMLGARELYDNGASSVGDAARLALELRSDGGVFQANHPAEGSTDFPHDMDWGYGYAVQPDTVEVWNISRLWQPPMPSASSNDDAVRYWEGWLDRGAMVGATGGSDSHYIWTSLALLGSPTTWVYVSERSERGILDGLRAGRTYISHQPPALRGPGIFLEGDADRDGVFESMVGDAVPPGSPLRVRVTDAPGAMLRVVTDRGRDAFEPIPVTGPEFEHRFRLPGSSTWVRAEIFEPDASEARSATCDPLVGDETTYCRNALAVLAMTSALYLRDRVATILTYTGATRARGERVHLEATLTEQRDQSVGVEGAEITFTIAGRRWVAVTGSDGVAETDATVPDHGRSQVVVARFEGDATHLPSETSATITWGH